MTAALNGYAAGVARLLLDKLAFTEGTTTLGQLHKASEVLTQTSEAVKGLTREQLALLPAEQVAGVSRAQLLLAVYTRASEQLDTWLKNDKASYADVAQRLERLADSVRQELERSVDRDSAAKALGPLLRRQRGGADLLHRHSQTRHAPHRGGCSQDPPAACPHGPTTP